MSRFEPYPKTPRMRASEMTITEKIDGTNAQILIEGGQIVCIGSRKREIFPEGSVVNLDVKQCCETEYLKGTDNAGFASWVRENEEGLTEFLGDGRHFGEWAGPGIQGNPLDLSRKLFFLFNTHRNPGEKFAAIGHLVPDLRSVPIVYTGPFNLLMVGTAHEDLLREGSRVSLSDRDSSDGVPEGIIISAFGQKFKRTSDDRPKGAR